MAQTYQLPHIIREELFRDLPKDKASKLAELIEKSIDTVFSNAKDIAIQKKLELKDELSKELASKTDVELAVQKLDKKITVWGVVLLSAMIIFNKDSLTLIGQILGLVK